MTSFVASLGGRGFGQCFQQPVDVVHVVEDADGNAEAVLRRGDANVGCLQRAGQFGACILQSEGHSNLSIQQDFPIASSLTGFVGGNWSFVGSRESTFVSSAPDSTPRFTLPSYSLVDVQTGITYGSGWRASLFLRNAFNKLGVITADNRNGTSVTSVNYLQPRTVGMNVSKEF